MNTSTLKTAFEFGYKKTREHLSFLVLTSAIVIVFSILLNGLQKMASDSSVILGALFFALTFAIDIIIKIGYTVIYLKIIEGEDVHIMDLFTLHGTFFEYCVAYVLLSLITIAGFSLLIVPGFIIVCMFIFVPILVIDREQSVVEAFNKSYEMTKGNKWYILQFIICTFVLNVLGFFFFVVGLLITIPISYFALMFLYKQLLGETPSL